MRGASDLTFSVGIGLAVFLTLAGCGPGSSGSDEQRAPNVILVTVDTLRADHLGCYGYDRPTSPQIDRLAQHSTRYRRALASSPWTVPSHASLLTGKLPFEHGAHTVNRRGPGPNARPLALEHLTLAEALSAEGWTTAAFVANAACLSRRWQLDQGFATYHVEKAYADVLNSRVLAWLGMGPDQPFLLFVNYIDAHHPFNTAPRPGLLDRPVLEDHGALFRSLYDEILPAEGALPAGHIEAVIDQYDTAVANVDEELGRLFDRLRQLGLYDSSLVVVTSDHGEYFGEHWLIEHSKDVYQEALWVPLLVKAPGQAQGRVEEALVLSSDIPGLILDHCPQELAARHRQAFPQRPGRHPVISENYYTRSKDLFHPRWGHRFERVRTAVYDWPYKYIHSSDGAHELYDLEADPSESVNLVEQRPELAARLRQELEALQRNRPTPVEEGTPAPLTDEELDNLRSLGYVD